MNNFAAAADFELKCPFKKSGNLSLTNLMISDQFVPPLFTEQKWCVDINLKVQIAGTKKFKDLILSRSWVRLDKGFF